MGFIGFRAALKARFGISKQPKVNDYELSKLSSTVIQTVPKTDFAKYDLVVVLGGISYATPQFMLDELKSSKAKGLLYSNIFLFLPYNIAWATAQKYINQIKGKYNVRNTSLIGFSAGGTDVQQNYNPAYKLVGLIDPSTNANFASRSYGKNVRMIYNDANWTGRYAGIGRSLVKLEGAINNSGGKAKKVVVRHRSMPKYFYETYEEQINGTKA